MEKEKIEKILRQQLELLAEESKENVDHIVGICHAMCEVSLTLLRLEVQSQLKSSGRASTVNTTRIMVGPKSRWKEVKSCQRNT